MRPAHQVLVSGILLGKFLVHHIAIRLYGTQEIPQECMYRSLATAVILVIVIEEVGYLLRLVHKNPHVLLEVSAKFGPVTLKLDSDCLFVNKVNSLLQALALHYRIIKHRLNTIKTPFKRCFKRFVCKKLTVRFTLRALLKDDLPLVCPCSTLKRCCRGH